MTRTEKIRFKRENGFSCVLQDVSGYRVEVYRRVVLKPGMPETWKPGNPEFRNDGNPENKSRNPKTRNYFSQKTKIRTVLSGA